ncbi:hypothetical protein BJ944DRAFT_275483, partial [Cunninghamella echinulata]
MSNLPSHLQFTANNRLKIIHAKEIWEISPNIHRSDNTSLRDKIAAKELLKYENYLSVKRDQDVLKEEEKIKEKTIKKVKTNGQYYEFKHSKLKEPCHYGHFQLRNLLWATSKNSVYFIKGNTACKDQILFVGSFLGNYVIQNLNSYYSHPLRDNNDHTLTQTQTSSH